MPPKSKDHSSPSTVSNILENTAVAKHSRPIDSRQHFIHSKMLMQSLSFLSPQEILGTARSSRQFTIQCIEAIKQYQLFKRFESEYKKGEQAAQFLDLVVGYTYNFALILNSQRKQEVYAWGANNYGSLGLGDNRYRYTPTKLELSFLKPGFRIHSLVATEGHSLALTQNMQGEQEIYVWGHNLSGQLGLGDNIRHYTPTKLELSFLKPGFRIHSLVAGERHTLALTQNAQGKQGLYVWGLNHYGQLGLGDNNSRNTPSRLNLGFLKPGYRIHSLVVEHLFNCILALNAQGEQELYVWGSNHYGQLGLGDHKSRNTPSRLNLGFLKPGYRIHSLVTGGCHTLTLTQNAQGEQEIYVWGHNQYGQLGLGDNKSLNTPSRLNLGFLKPGFRIHSLVAAGYHNLTLTQNAQGEQELYVWGNNDEGQLGLGDNKSLNTPSRLNLGFLKPGFRIHSLVVEHLFNCILALNAQGEQELYVWGNNDYGELGLGDNKRRNIPSRLNLGFLKPGYSIHSLVAGGEHNLTLTQNAQGEQEIYVWGRNDYGELGLGDSGEDKCRNTPTKLDLSFLKPGFRILRLITRGVQSFALTHNSEGALLFYAWGGNAQAMHWVLDRYKIHKILKFDTPTNNLLDYFKEKGFHNSALAKLLENTPTSPLSQFSTFCSRHPRFSIIAAAGISLSLYALWRQKPKSLNEIITKIAAKLSERPLPR